MKCSAKLCSNESVSKGFCDKHYRRFKKYGNEEYVTIHQKKQCSAESCNRNSVSKGFCDKHYRRYLKHGDPNYEIVRITECMFEDCNEKSIAKKMCYTHYHANRQKIILTEEDKKYIDDHNGLCDICGNSKNYSNKKLSKDHDHQTGHFRGMLCTKCNLGLGKFSDSPELLIRAAEYIYRSKNPMG